MLFFIMIIFFKKTKVNRNSSKNFANSRQVHKSFHSERRSEMQSEVLLQVSHDELTYLSSYLSIIKIRQGLPVGGFPFYND